MNTRYPWHVEDSPRPLLNPKPRLGLPMDDPCGEDAPYDGHAEGKYVCPKASRCEVCWPEVKP